MNGTMTTESSFVKSRAKLFAYRSEEEVVVDRKSNKTPSYVSLSCAVSGYSGLKYDSRPRDTSRDRSVVPLFMARSRESSPSPIKVGVNRQSSGFIMSDISVVDHATTVQNQTRSKSVDRGYLRQNFLNSSQHISKPPSGIAVTYKTTLNAMVNGGSSEEMITKSAPTERGRNRVRSSTVPHEIGQHDSKSVIQQKIERLYGPAALARGFFLVKSPMKTPTTVVSPSFTKDSITTNGIPLNNNNITHETSNGSQECSTPPVFRHLNAEFRQQLSLKKRSPSIEHSKSPVIAKEPAVLSSPEPQAVVSITSNGSPALSVNGIQTSSQEDDGHKFLRILEEEKIRIEVVIAKNEIYLMDPIVTSSEELAGKIHAAVGKAKLLLAQKFKQFAGLCHKNLTQSPDEPFPTTGQDLAGFWDMVTIQVEHIRTLFNEIQRVKDNGWKEPEITKVTVKNAKKNRPTGTTTATAPRSAKAEEAARAREEARRKMMEDKRRMIKAKKSGESEGVAVFPIIENQLETNLVDGEETVV